MQMLLLSLYPKAWRDQYGEEYEALLEDTGMSAATVFDIVKAACLLRFKAHERGLHVVLSLSLYALCGLICLRLGLTDNWPLWAPTNPARATGLFVTLLPLAYALYIRFSSLRDYQRQWRGSGMAYWLVVSPLTAISTMVLAFVCSFSLFGTGIVTLAGEHTAFIVGALMMALIGLMLVKLLDSIQNRLLHRFTP